MGDQFSVELEDDVLRAEVELTALIMVAANKSKTPLSQEEIDRLLGVI